MLGWYPPGFTLNSQTLVCYQSSYPIVSKKRNKQNISWAFFTVETGDRLQHRMTRAKMNWVKWPFSALTVVRDDSGDNQMAHISIGTFIVKYGTAEKQTTTCQMLSPNCPSGKTKPVLIKLKRFAPLTHLPERQSDVWAFKMWADRGCHLA